MKTTQEPPIKIFEHEFKMGEEMSYITFGDLVKELTGSPFDKVFKNFSMLGENHENNME